MPSDLAQSDSPSLFSTMARSKLHSAVSGGVKDSCSLHRWVLLKNLIIRSHPADPAPSQADAGVQHVSRRDAQESRDELEEDAFMFPDPHALGSRSADGDSEKEWLDSLLEGLGDDNEDAFIESPGTASVVLSIDDDDETLSPLCSPMSSSDDLVGHSSLFYQPPPIAIPYPVPYPPLPSPLAPSWLQLDLHDALPYYDADDAEDFPVPDAIDDTSDDESDALSTPYRSMSSLSPLDPASVPLPSEPRRMRAHPHVYVDMDDAFFYPFELDPPSPFHEHNDSGRAFHPPIYQEC